MQLQYLMRPTECEEAKLHSEGTCSDVNVACKIVGLKVQYSQVMYSEVEPYGENSVNLEEKGKERDSPPPLLIFFFCLTPGNSPAPLWFGLSFRLPLSFVEIFSFLLIARPTIGWCHCHMVA